MKNDQKVLKLTSVFSVTEGELPLCKEGKPLLSQVVHTIPLERCFFLTRTQIQMKNSTLQSLALPQQLLPEWFTCLG